MYSKLNLLVSFSILVISAPIFAEEHAQPTGSGTDTATTRPENNSRIDTREVDLISDLFDVPREVVQTRYGSELPAAIEQARPVSVGGQGEESGTAKIIAELIGTRSNDQLDSKVMPKIEAEMKNELSKDGTDKNRYLDFLKRVFWAGKIIDGKESTKPEAQAFNKEFKKAFKDNQDKIKDFYSKVDIAATGNEAAKKDVLNQVNRASVLSFIDSQRKAGNGKDVVNLVKALSSNEGGKKGEIYLKGKDNQVQSLVVGNTSSEILASLKTFSEKNNGFGNFSLSVTPPNALLTDGTVATTAQGGATPTAPAGGDVNIGTIRSTLQGNCLGCHGGTVTGTSVKDVRFVKDGKENTLKDIVRALTSISAMQTKVAPAVKSQIQSWAAQQ